MGAPTSKAQVELKKGPWTREEDQKLLAYIQQHGHGSWRNLPAKAGLWRCGKSCRLRWTNYLRPDIKRGKFSTHEEKAIIRLHALLGNRWSAIAAHLPKRTDNEIKNYWNTRLKKRLTRMGIDPVTHKPKNNPAGSAQSRNDAALSHMAQWETARLEAEARLARQSKLMSSIRLFHRSTARPPPPPPPPQHLASTPPLLDVLKVWQTSSIPSCFLTSPGTLESPTSTLNFSSNNLTVPTVSSVMENNVVSMNNNYGACGVGLVDSYPEMENSLQLQDENVVYDPTAYDCDMMIGSVDLAVFNHDSNGYNMLGAGQFEDCKSYWNDLLDLVSPNME